MNVLTKQERKEMAIMLTNLTLEETMYLEEKFKQIEESSGNERMKYVEVLAIHDFNNPPSESKITLEAEYAIAYNDIIERAFSDSTLDADAQRARIDEQLEYLNENYFN